MTINININITIIFISRKVDFVKVFIINVLDCFIIRSFIIEVSLLVSLTI